MVQQQLYEEAVQRLRACGYDVSSDERGYIVQHWIDHADVSGARSLPELVDLADLMEWAEQRRRPSKREAYSVS